jgi:hypothetical protein
LNAGDNCWIVLESVEKLPSLMTDALGLPDERVLIHGMDDGLSKYQVIGVSTNSSNTDGVKREPGK